MAKETWIPLPYAAEATDGEINVGPTGLPVGLDQERIELNVGALRRGVIGWGGYRVLLLGSYQGEEDQVSFGASGVDASGTAQATAAGSLSRAKSSEHVSLPDPYANSQDIRNGGLAARWNITALNSRLEIHQQYDPQVRAKQLNREIKKSLIRGVAKHNTVEVLDDRSLIGNLFYLGLDGWLLTDVAHAALARDYAGAAGRLASRAAASHTLIRYFETRLNGVSFSEGIGDLFLWTARPTRAAIASGIIATNKLVRAV